MSSGPDLARRVVATGGLMVATLMVTIDMTIANVSLPHMQGSLSASPEQITWVLTSYIVSTAIMTPLSGWLAHRIGRKRLLLISAATFVALSMLCGAATSLPEMVAFRVLQGAAGASLIPLSQAALLDLWPRRLIPQTMAVWSGVVMAAPILGPTLGGYLTEAVSWRWCFYINLPVGLVGVAGIYLALPKDAGGRTRPLDMLGLGALMLFTACTQLVVDRGPGRDWFDSPEIWAEVLLALCGLYVFLIQTLAAEHPYFHRDLFRDRNFTSSVVFSALFAAMLFSTAALTPSMMQQLLGYSALQSGLATAPRGLGTVLGFALAPWLAPRLGVRRTMLLGLCMNMLAQWMMGHFDLAMTVTPIRVSGMLQGFGQALVFNPMAVISYATLAAAHRTEAAVLASMLRNLGGSLGIAMLQASQLRQSAAAHEALAANITPTDPVIGWALPRALQGPDGLAALNAEVTRQSAMIAYDAAFGWLCLISLAMAPLVFIMRPARPGRGEVIEAPVD